MSTPNNPQTIIDAKELAKELARVLKLEERIRSVERRLNEMDEKHVEMIVNQIPDVVDKNKLRFGLYDEEGKEIYYLVKAERVSE